MKLLSSGYELSFWSLSRPPFIAHDQSTQETTSLSVHHFNLAAIAFLVSTMPCQSFTKVLTQLRSWIPDVMNGGMGTKELCRL